MLFRFECLLLEVNLLLLAIIGSIVLLFCPSLLFLGPLLPAVPLLLCQYFTYHLSVHLVVLILDHVELILIDDEVL